MFANTSPPNQNNLCPLFTSSFYPYAPKLKETIPFALLNTLK